ncbi:MAG TPA: hypothetical protein VG650_06085 [Mycobacteriales bacterium]|nr:hypothetical protein [Mycobacteriales bacterium]
MADSVQLTDLDVIARYSIAVRAATADRDELLETLRADVAWLERGRSRASTSAYRAPADGSAGDEADDVTSQPARTSAKKAPAKRAATRRAPRN